MKGSGIKNSVLATKLRWIEKVYCQQLLLAGTVNTCEESISVGVKLPYHVLRNPTSKFVSSEILCISRCFENRYCSSIDSLVSKNDNNFIL